MSWRLPSRSQLERHKGVSYKVSQIIASRTEEDVRNHRTKIACTMGPACRSVEQLVEMIQAGMNVARFNLSHGSHKDHDTVLGSLREAMKLSGQQVGILLDTNGPEVRTGLFKSSDMALVEAGDTIKLVTNYQHEGDKSCFAVSYPNLPRHAEVGSTVLIADGSLVLKVLEVGEDFISCEALNSAEIGEKKNLSLPHVKLDLPACGPKEIDDITRWGIPNGIHFIATSARSADDVLKIREVLGENANKVGILAKIDSVDAITNFTEILAVSDGIIIARGGLGMTISPEKVFLAQKRMIAQSNLAGKPVITATQMLESMVKAPRPTRAEASDVANAVLDGTDCVMINAESASGKYPLQAVQILARICLEAESCINYPLLFHGIRLAIERPVSIPEAICASAVRTAEDVDVQLIMVLTDTGSSARLIAKYKPEQRILAVTADKVVGAQLQLVRGVVTCTVSTLVGTDKVLISALDHAKKEAMVASGDLVVCVHGMQEAVPGRTNLVKVVTCQ